MVSLKYKVTLHSKKNEQIQQKDIQISVPWKHRCGEWFKTTQLGIFQFTVVMECNVHVLSGNPVRLCAMTRVMQSLWALGATISKATFYALHELAVI